MKQNEQQYQDDLSRSNSQSAITNNLQSDINLNINVTINQSRKKKTTKSAVKEQQKKQKQKDLMNTSLSKMLDQQLLYTNDPKKDRTKDVDGNILDEDTMTYKQFHGDKIYLQGGAMAFKPLGMETVLEKVDEEPKDWKRKLKTGVTNYQTKLAPQTTE